MARWFCITTTNGTDDERWREVCIHTRERIESRLGAPVIKSWCSVCVPLGMGISHRPAIRLESSGVGIGDATGRSTLPPRRSDYEMNFKKNFIYHEAILKPFSNHFFFYKNEFIPVEKLDALSSSRVERKRVQLSRAAAPHLVVCPLNNAACRASNQGRRVCVYAVFTPSQLSRLHSSVFHRSQPMKSRHVINFVTVKPSFS